MKIGHQVPEAVKARAEQEDPIVMYLIVRESLGMGMGKACAQCGHAVGMLIFEYYDLKEESKTIQRQMEPIIFQPRPQGAEMARLKTRYIELSRKLSIMGEWKSQSYRKVTLVANEKKWKELKESTFDHVLVIDSGLTEVPSGSETCLGFWPMRKSQRPKILTRLQAL